MYRQSTAFEFTTEVTVIYMFLWASHFESGSVDKYHPNTHLVGMSLKLAYNHLYRYATVNFPDIVLNIKAVIDYYQFDCNCYINGKRCQVLLCLAACVTHDLLSYTRASVAACS